GEWRPEFMRCRSDNTAEIGQLLFARERHLRRKERIAHQPDLGRDATGIETEKDDANDDGQPEAEAEDRRYCNGVATARSQGHIDECDERDERDGHKPEEYRRASLERGGRNRGGREDQERERVVEAAGEVQQ